MNRASGGSEGQRDAESVRQAARAVEKVRKIPDTFREFSVSAADAARVHRIDPGALERLLDLGLPHSGTGSDRRFDRLDLDNIGIDLRLPCPRWTAMRWWSRALPDRITPGVTAYDLVLKTDCPTPERPHDCEVVFYPGTVKPGEPAAVRRRPHEEYRIELTTQWVDHCFGEPFTVLIGEILPIEFHLMPKPLTADPGFAATAGLADCRMATDLLARTANRLGLPVRPVAGLFLARPFAIRHWWIEVLDDGVWVAADPFLLNAFLRWGITDPSRWPVSRSPSGVLWELAVPSMPMASHGGESAKTVKALSAPRPAAADRRTAPESIAS